MASRQVHACDLCSCEMTLAEGHTPNRIMVEPAHGPEIGSAHDSKDVCDICKARLYELFPALAEAERLVRPVPVPASEVKPPAALDTVSPEQLLVLLAQKLGVKVEQKE